MSFSFLVFFLSSLNPPFFCLPPYFILMGWWLGEDRKQLLWKCWHNKIKLKGDLPACQQSRETKVNTLRVGGHVEVPYDVIFTDQTEVLCKHMWSFLSILKGYWTSFTQWRMDVLKIWDKILEFFNILTWKLVKGQPKILWNHPHKNFPIPCTLMQTLC